ncbi:transcription termination factor NusA [Ichthyobacterium seriolicida]|uniref:Transcription termination/antitermination protein NusA n=1 Tax=Ichthyobacterium seriolicida TaxID=242600 RepID=A0A1J1E4S3_9FLAO|nr:transcription termination factor NusA [Ichthyobacterium seriolicida]BAV95052.1 transcription elongation factor NusA [Ichthyobacterium seriolicida]
MNSIALIESFAEFKDIKSINRESLMSILEEVFRGVLSKKYGSDENFDIIVNPDKGDLEIWRNRVVVADEDLECSNKEISLSDAKEIESDFEIGESVVEPVYLKDLGRRGILYLRQGLSNKIQEYDSVIAYNKFIELKGEIITGEVHFVNRRNRTVIVIDDAQNEMILGYNDQIPSDSFRKGDTVRAIIKDVVLKNGKPFIFISRSSEGFLSKLFELEIPEILDGLIVVKGVARIPGERAKIAVESYDDRIDPVGACVGIRGNRIHGIVRELNNENIDVVNYTTNTQLYISRALSTAKPTSIIIDEEKKQAVVNLKPEDISKAIGKKGFNIRLASKLTGYEVEIYREALEGEEEDVELTEFCDEIDEWVINTFKGIGCDTAKSVLDLSIPELIKRTDLEEDTVAEVYKILQKEFE